MLQSPTVYLIETSKLSFTPKRQKQKQKDRKKSCTGNQLQKLITEGRLADTLSISVFCAIHRLGAPTCISAVDFPCLDSTEWNYSKRADIERFYTGCALMNTSGWWPDRQEQLHVKHTLTSSAVLVTELVASRHCQKHLEATAKGSRMDECSADRAEMF